MSKVDVKNGPYSNTPVREGGQEVDTPEARRISVLHLADFHVEQGVSVYPDVLVAEQTPEQPVQTQPGPTITTYVAAGAMGAFQNQHPEAN